MHRQNQASPFDEADLVQLISGLPHPAAPEAVGAFRACVMVLYPFAARLEITGRVSLVDENDRAHQRHCCSRSDAAGRAI